MSPASNTSKEALALGRPRFVQSVCPFCFAALPSCTWETNSQCPSDTSITENIALVAAVSSATAIAGGKLFKMPAVMAQKYLRMFSSASLSALLRQCLKSCKATHREAGRAVVTLYVQVASALAVSGVKW